MDRKAIFITGGASGIGRAIAQLDHTGNDLIAAHVGTPPRIRNS